MNVILTVGDEAERDRLEKAVRCVDHVSEVIILDDAAFAISQMEKGIANLAVFDLELIRNNLVETLINIQNMKEFNKRAKILLLADQDEDVMTTAAFRFGINYVFIRPYSLDNLISRINDLSAEGIVINETLENKNKTLYIERMTSSILNSTGILPNLKGYKYLKDAIVKGYSDNSMLDAVTKFLYPEVAKKHKTTTDRVERAIRHAIASAWNRCGGNNFYSKMGFGSAFNNKRPTNSEYIFAVVEYLNNHAL